MRTEYASNTNKRSFLSKLWNKKGTIKEEYCSDLSFNCRYRGIIGKAFLRSLHMSLPIKQPIAERIVFLPLLTHTIESTRRFVRMRKSDGDTQW